MKLFTTLFVLLPVLAGAQTRVYLTPLPVSTFVDADSKRLSDSQADLAKSIKDVKTWRLVTEKEQADIVLTLVSSKQENSGSSMTQQSTIGILAGVPDASKSTAPILVNVVRLKLQAGEYEHEFKGQGFWRAAAMLAVKDVERWVKENEGKLGK